MRITVLLLLAVFTSCTPDRIEGTVLQEEWTPHELQAALRITSGDVVTVRFTFAQAGRPGYDEGVLRKDSLTGKRLRIALGSGLQVNDCTILLPEGERRIWRVGER